MDQPNKRSRILNRVPHGEESRIDGALSSNGTVYILNPAGVFIGDRAVLDMNSLVAGAASLSNKDFMKGVDRFTDVTGDVGVAAGAQVRATRDVVLVGRNVENLGSISSERGMVALVAGGGVLLTRHGGHVMVRVDDAPGEAPAGSDFALTQGGQVEGQYVTLAAGDAYSLAMNHTGVTRAGEIHVQSEGDGLVQVAGTLDASNAAPGEKGGSIRVDGGRVAVQDAVLDASGAAGGGEILVGGDVRGGGDGPSARRVFVGEDATLRADATASGDGGKIVVYADEQTSFYGQLSARGGAQGGDGGFAEISGASLVARGDVDLGAAQGEAGTLLYDPDKIVIIGGSPVTGDGSDLPDTSDVQLSSASRLGQVLSGDTGALVGDAFQIYESEIEGTDANIVLEATNRIEVSGNFNHDSHTNPASGETAYEGDGFVVILPGNSLTLRTTGTTVPQGLGTDDLGIDLTGSDQGNALTWRVSKGGNITLATNLAQREFGNNDELPTTPKASIQVGRLESTTAKFQGFDNVDVQISLDRSIDISANRGDIIVNEIDAHGADAAPAVDDLDPATEDEGFSATSGAEINITSGQGDIQVTGPIQGWGGSGTIAQGSRGGDGSEITIGTEGGNVIISGDIDVHGGDGLGAFTFDNPLDPSMPNKLTGGGAGGAIGIAAHGSNVHQGALTISSVLVPAQGPTFNARGGDGRPFLDTKETLDTGDDEVIAAAGGVGGAVALSGTRTITVGTTANPVRFDASGGDGSTNGGSARNDFELADLPGPTFKQAFRFTGLVEGATLGTTEGRVEIHGRLIARGGDGRQFVESVPADLQADIPGGGGGSGGGLFVQSNSLDASEMLLDQRGGNGSLPTAGATDPPLASDGNPIPLGGNGGNVSVFAEKTVDLGGRITGLADSNGELPGFGIISRGGDAENGVGGDGGFITVSNGDLGDSGGQAGDVDLVVGDIDVSGGNSRPLNGATKIPLVGGNGGSVALFAREKNTGRVLLRGRLGGEGGIGDDGKTANPLHAEGAFVNLGAAKIIQVDEPSATAAGVVLAGSNVTLDAPTIGTDTAPVAIAGTGRSGKEGSDVATARATQKIAVEVRTENQLPIGADTDAAPDALENLNLELTEATATTLVQRGGVDIVTGAGADNTRHTITAMKTAAGDPSITYRLDVLPGANEPQPDLAIARGAVELGTAGGQIINGGIPNPEDPSGIANNRGRIIGTGDGSAPHVTSAGTVRLQGGKRGETDTAAIGANGAPIEVAGAGDESILRLDANGDIDAAVVPVETADFRAIEIVQFDANGAVDVAMRGTDGIHIVSATDSEQPNKPISRIASAVTTTSQTGFSYRFQALPKDDSVDEAMVQVDRMDLGGDGLLVTRGDIVLRDRRTDGVETPIVTNGNALTLASIAGAIRQEATGDAAPPSIDMIGSSGLTADERRELVLVANDDIGSTATPLRTRGVAKIAGQAETGDFVIVNDDPNGSGLRIQRLAPRDPALLEVPDNVQNYFGIGAGSPTELNSIDITNRGSPGEDRIILGDLTEGLEFVLPHLRAGDDVRLHADAIDIENARFFEVNQPGVGQFFLRFNDARIVAGDDVVLDGPVRTSTDAVAKIEPPEEGEEPIVNPPADEFVHGKLLVQAGGTVTYGGDVGGDGSDGRHELMRLDTTSAIATGATRSFKVGQAQFRGTLDGPAVVNIVASDPAGLTNSVHDATVTFDGDLGGKQRLGGLDVNAEKIRFTSANNVSATGAITLATNQTSVPQAATISDTTGGLRIQTDGTFTLAENEKLSVQGPLGIRASSVTVGDVNAASQLSIDSPLIQIRARAASPLLLKDGTTVTDRGTDLVADRIRLSSVPTVLDEASQPDGVRIGVGGGGISAPSGIFQSFEVVYATPDVQHVTTSDMQGPNGQVLDLEARGRAVVSDPSSDIPRERPLTDPSLAPRYSKEGPAPAPAVDAEQLLAYLRCGDANGPAGDCATADAEQLGAVRDWSDSALATPRAEQLAQSYREMRSRDLSAAFDAAGSGFREAQGFGEFDPSAFARYLEQSPDHPEARAAIHRLANVLVEIDLLGLPPEDATRIRNELAGELAAEADLPGFDADAVLLAVDATPIELPD
ncbi:MAG TPA: filamentous hemagglutinin N-terminal domain-containing protein [Myxococcota bacterium]|nr:filamentous hemagglutinin N-terminal domain-containing protein [Myxococcota bacterium]